MQDDAVAQVWMQRGTTKAIVRTVAHSHLTVTKERAIAFAKLQARLAMAGSPETWPIYWVEISDEPHPVVVYTSLEDESLDWGRAHRGKA